MTRTRFILRRRRKSQKSEASEASVTQLKPARMAPTASANDRAPADVEARPAA